MAIAASATASCRGGCGSTRGEQPVEWRGETVHLRHGYIKQKAVISELPIPDVSSWMRDVSADGYAPKSRPRAFRLPKQAPKSVDAR